MGLSASATELGGDNELLAGTAPRSSLGGQ
jgi:hypothetical protein